MKKSLATGLLALSTCSALATTDPFATQNRSPFERFNGLPTPENAATLLTGKSSHQIGFELTSHFVGETSANEELIIDGETAALIYDWRFGLTDSLELGANVPVVSHGGGFMDSFVEGWHDFFSFPDGNRDTRPRNQLLYAAQNGLQTVSYSDSTTELGDIGLQAKQRFYQGDSSVASALLRVELPTGQAKNFTGNGGADIALGAMYSNSNCMDKTHCHISGGVIWFGGNDVYSDASEDVGFYAAATIARPIWKQVQAKLQLETHSAMYDSETEALGDQTFQVSFGVGIPLNKSWVLDLGMSEDISPGTAPDFTFLVGIKRLAD